MNSVPLGTKLYGRIKVILWTSQEPTWLSSGKATWRKETELLHLLWWIEGWEKIMCKCEKRLLEHRKKLRLNWFPWNHIQSNKTGLTFGTRLRDPKKVRMLRRVVFIQWRKEYFWLYKYKTENWGFFRITIRPKVKCVKRMAIGSSNFISHWKMK